MKVVIDIPENDYKLACNHPDALIACYAHYIKAGVPLPKNHGRLIDADDVKSRMIPLSFSVQKWVDEVELSNCNTVIEAEGE